MNEWLSDEAEKIASSASAQCTATLLMSISSPSYSSVSPSKMLGHDEPLNQATAYSRPNLRGRRRMKLSAAAVDVVALNPRAIIRGKITWPIRLSPTAFGLFSRSTFAVDDSAVGTCYPTLEKSQ